MDFEDLSKIMLIEVPEIRSPLLLLALSQCVYLVVSSIGLEDLVCIDLLIQS